MNNSWLKIINRRHRVYNRNTHVTTSRQSNRHIMARTRNVIRTNLRRQHRRPAKHISTNLDRRFRPQYSRHSRVVNTIHRHDIMRQTNFFQGPSQLPARLRSRHLNNRTRQLHQNSNRQNAKRPINIRANPNRHRNKIRHRQRHTLHLYQNRSLSTMTTEAVSRRLTKLRIRNRRRNLRNIIKSHRRRRITTLRSLISIRRVNLKRRNLHAFLQKLTSHVNNRRKIPYTHRNNTRNASNTTRASRTNTRTGARTNRPASRASIVDRSGTPGPLQSHETTDSTPSYASTTNQPTEALYYKVAQPPIQSQRSHGSAPTRVSILPSKANSGLHPTQ